MLLYSLILLLFKYPLFADVQDAHAFLTCLYITILRLQNSIVYILTSLLYCYFESFKYVKDMVICIITLWFLHIRGRIFFQQGGNVMILGCMLCICIFYRRLRCVYLYCLRLYFHFVLFRWRKFFYYVVHNQSRPFTFCLARYNFNVTLGRDT